MTKFKFNIGVLNRSKSITYDLMLKKMSKKGAEMIQEAYATKETENDTYNQHDAYTYGVFYMGRLVEQGFLIDGELSKTVHRGWDKHGYPSGTGREYATDAMKALEGSVGRNGFALVVMNPMFYTKILENGAQSNSGRAFKVISQVFDEGEAFAREIGGTSSIISTIR